MSNAGAALTLDCWLNIISLSLLSFVFFKTIAVLDSSGSCNLQWLAMLKPTTLFTLVGLV